MSTIGYSDLRTPTTIPNSDGTKQRCPLGYVVQDSYVSTVESGEGSGPRDCEKEYCDPIGIIDSDKEYDVIIDQGLGENTTVVCNEGYVFKTTGMRAGNVKCGALPKFGADITDNTKSGVTWIVDNEHAEQFCSSKIDEESCESEPIPDLLGRGHGLECTWFAGDTYGGFSTNGSCRFFKRADLNGTDPICEPMYCDEKEVYNSNRQSGVDGPLPGPETGRIYGSCINFDGEILDQIINSSDCNCFKHKSCDTCTAMGNCQWCGFDPDTKEGGFCYSVNTHLDICSTSGQVLRNNDNGTCLHNKTNSPRPNMPSSGWTGGEDGTCEGNFSCVKTSYYNGLEEGDSLIDSNYKQVSSEIECTSDNNYWDTTAHIDDSDTCVLRNDSYSLNNRTIFNKSYYPILEGEGFKVNVNEYICVPNTDSAGTIYSLTEECDSHKTKGSCDDSDNGCEWIENPMRNSRYLWDSSQARVILEGDVDNCPNVGGPYNVSLSSGYLTVNESVDPTITYSQFNNNCTMTPVEGDKYTDDTCALFGSPVSSQPHVCENGVRYCSNTQETDDGESACPNGSTFSLEGTIINGCRYFDTEAAMINNLGEIDGYNCFGDNLLPNSCTGNSGSPYNCEKSGEPNASSCNATDYEATLNSIGDITIPSVEGYEGGIFRDFVTCDVSDQAINSNESVKKRCGYIGDTNAHYGKVCQATIDGDTTYSIPIKHICEATLGYTWTNQQLDNGNYGWVCLDPDNQVVDNVCSIIRGDNDLNLALTISGDIPDWQSSDTDLCIIDKTGLENSELVNLCENFFSGPDSQNYHQVGYNFYENIHTSSGGVCRPNQNSGRPESEAAVFQSQETCEANNYEYINEYTYNDVTSCSSLGDQNITRADEPTNWTGGNTTLGGDGLYTSQCSSSIMSSCNASCDEGYGGGGEYICQYNSDGEDLCDEINDLDDAVFTDISREIYCNSYPACNFEAGEDGAEGSCQHVGEYHRGHLEWIGSECYHLDNTSFAHATAELPSLDNIWYFTPFLRVFYYIVAVSLLGFIFFYLFSRYLFKYFGMGIDGVINKSLKATDKLIDYNTVNNKLFGLIFDGSIDIKHKIGYILTIIGLFAGSIVTFYYTREYVHSFTDHIWDMVFSIWNTLMTHSFKLNLPNLGDTLSDLRDGDSGDDDAGDGDGVSSLVSGTDIDLDVTLSSDPNLTQDDRTLTKIIELTVLVLIIFIIILSYTGSAVGYFKTD